VSNKQPSFVDAQIEAIAAENDVDTKEAAQMFLKQSGHVVKLDELVPQNHIWVDRGELMSCEGANHESHRAFKTRR
jgi:hypothetical protein